MDKILITGTAGFLGSNLALKLLEDEDKTVFGIDNFSSSTISTLYPLLKCENFNFAEGNISESNLPYCDILYHFASCGDLKKYFEDKYEYIKNLINDIQIILSYAEKTGSKVVIATDFSAFDGDEFELLNKYCEFLIPFVESYIQKYKIDVKIVRFSYVYGKNASLEDDRIINKIIKSALENEEIIIKQDFSNYFINVQDTSYILKMIYEKHFDGTIIDIVSNEKMYLSEIIRKIIEITDSKSKVEILNPIKKDIKINPNKAFLSEIKMNEFIDIDIGLIDTINYFKQMLM